MAKILLVEDDNNLREIYEARLQAEGYTIVSAHDGEEALVVAKAEKPDLIISDVMMPKISGFEMLDILRNTDSLRNVKVIMLTALGQSEDQQRANKLGADKYLVKSQVTLEDIVNEANGLLQSGGKPVDATMPTAAGIGPSGPTNAPTTTTPQPSPPTNSQPPQDTASAEPPSPVQNASIGATDSNNTPASPPPTTTNIPVTEPPAAEPAEPAKDEPPAQATEPPKEPEVDSGLAESTTNEENEVKTQIEDFAKGEASDSPAADPEATTTPDTPKDSAEPFLTPADEPEDASAGYSPQPTGKKVIEPLPDTESKPSLDELLEREKAKELMDSTKTENPDAPPTMSAADTAPAPQSPIISPNSTDSAGDPNNVAL